MPCYHPISAYRAPGGEIKFSRPGAFVDRPLTLACGQCIGCRLERSRQWAVRIMHEAQMHERNSFITLTYDKDHLPADGSLNVKHYQNFTKAFRRHLVAVDELQPKKPKQELKYFHCGEYGDLNARPHYHSAILGQNFIHDRIPQKTTEAGFTLYTSETLSALWPHGLHRIGDLSFESAAYVARYILKKVTGSRADDHYAHKIDLDTGEVHYRKAEYTTMSRNPGLGKSFFDKYFEEIYRDDEIIVNGKPGRPPKYYDQLMEKKDADLMTKIKQKRVAQGEIHENNNTPDRLHTRETLAEILQTDSKRNL